MNLDNTHKPSVLLIFFVKLDI